MSESTTNTGDGSPVIDESGKNVQALVCPECSEWILPAGAAELEASRELFLPHPNAKNSTDGETLKNIWVVRSRYKFLNLTVSNPGEGKKDKVRFLSCGACEAGLFGCLTVEETQSDVKDKEKADSDKSNDESDKKQDPTEPAPGEVFYLAHDRVGYVDAPSGSESGGIGGTISLEDLQELLQGGRESGLAINPNMGLLQALMAQAKPQTQPKGDK